MSSERDPSHILDVGFAFWGSKVLLTAVELGLFTVLGDRAMTGEELRRELSLHRRGIWDFLDTLVATFEDWEFSPTVDRDRRLRRNDSATLRSSGGTRARNC